MCVVWRRQSEQRLQQARHGRRGEEIVAARHRRHALKRIIDENREMIRRRRVLACKDDVPEDRRINGDRPALAVRSVAMFFEGERADPCCCLHRVDAECVCSAADDPSFAFGSSEIAAETWIERPSRRGLQRQRLRIPACSEIDRCFQCEAELVRPRAWPCHVP